jgi:hypothetical protein
MDATIGEIIAAALREDQQARFDLWAQAVSAQALADDIGPRLGRLADEAYSSLLKISDNVLPLLHTPQGWAVLAEYVANDLGATSADYFPTIH